MELSNSNGELPGGPSLVVNDCPPDARRRKMDPEIQLNAIFASQAKKLSKNLPPPPPPPTASTKSPDQPQVVLGESLKPTEEDEALLAFTAALDEVCGDEDVPESTPENAPFDLVLDFMAAIMKEDFEQGLKLANMILKYEPTNETISEYLPILQELIQLDYDESDSSCTTDSEVSDSDAESCTSHSGDDTESTDSSVTGEDGTEADEGHSEVMSVTSESTVASDEYLSEYGEEYEHAVLGEDDGYETNGTPQRDEEEEE